MHKTAVLALALALTACSSAADDRAEACERALEEHLDATGFEDLSSFDERELGGGQYELTGHLDGENGLGEPSQIQIICTMGSDGDTVSIVTDPAF